MKTFFMIGWNMLLLAFVYIIPLYAQCITDQASGPYPWYRGINTPVAVYTNNMTFFVFHGGQPAWLDPLIMKYDHTTGLTEGPIKVGENLLTYFNDTHGAPAVQVDRAGYVHVIYGGHGWTRPYMCHAVSDAPFDISSWTHLNNIVTTGTYPTIFNIPDNKMFYYYREGNVINNHRTNWVFCLSSDNGRTWSPPEKLLLGGAKREDGIYFTTSTYYDGWYGNMWEIKGEVHYVVQYHPCICAETTDKAPEDKRRLNIYYLRRDTNGIWRSPEGTERTPPFSRENMDDYFRIKTSNPLIGSNGFESITPRDFQVSCAGEPMILYRSEYYDTTTNPVCNIAWGTTNGTFTFTNAPYTWFMRPSATDSNTVEFYGDWGIYISTNRCETHTFVTDPFSTTRTTTLTEIPGAPETAFVLSMQPITTDIDCNTNALKLYLWGTNGYISPLTFNQQPLVPGTPNMNVVGFDAITSCSNTMVCVYGTRTNVLFQEYDPVRNEWFNLESIHAGDNPGCITDSNLVRAGGVSIAAATNGMYHILWNEAPEVGAGNNNLVWMKGKPGNWGTPERVLRSTAIPNNRFPRLLYDKVRDVIAATWIATGTNSQFIAEWPVSADATTVSNAMHTSTVYAFESATWSPCIAWNPEANTPGTVIQAIDDSKKADIQFAQRLTSGWPSSPQAVATTTNAHDSYPTLTYLSDGTACVAYHTDSPTTGLAFSILTDAGWTNYITSVDAYALDIASTFRSNTLFALVSSASGLDLIRFKTDTGTILDSYCLDKIQPDWMGGHFVSFTNGAIFAIWQCTDSIGGKTLFYSRLIPCGAADNDNDQLPDEWEIQYGGMTNLQSGTHDFDHDNLSDTDEYIAGSIPDDDSSVFQLQTPSQAGENAYAEVCWSSLSERLYTLYRTTNILDQTAWQMIDGAMNLPGTGSEMTYTGVLDHVSTAFRITVKSE